jgi:hypothetical protein
MATFKNRDGSDMTQIVDGVVHHMSHGLPAPHPGDNPKTRGNIARDGAPKKSVPCQVHAGMGRRQQVLAGMGHPNESAGLLDHVNTSPLRPVQQGKRITEPKAAFGQRSRVGEPCGPQPHCGAFAGVGVGKCDHELGSMVLAEALHFGSHNDLSAHSSSRSGLVQRILPHLENVLKKARG